MTWIKTVSLREGGAKLREAMRWRALYPKEYAAEVPALAEVASTANGGGISDSHTLLPDTLYHAFAMYGTLLAPDLPLERRQQEMIATVVSVLNDCFY